MSRLQGKVKFFNDAKGFGFIAPSDGSKDVFVHANSLQNVGGSLREGETVSFESQQGQKGIEAVNVDRA